MGEKPSSRPTIPCDEAGYLLDPDDWSEEVAQVIASRDGLGLLTHDQWEVLIYLRAYFYQYRALPDMRHLCADTHHSAHCLLDLFGKRGGEACRIAGLPYPGEEAQSYMT